MKKRKKGEEGEKRRNEEKERGREKQEVGVCETGEGERRREGSRVQNRSAYRVAKFRERCSCGFFLLPLSYLVNLRRNVEQGS